MEVVHKPEPDSAARQLALLYMANQDNEGKTPEALYDEYEAAFARIERHMETRYSVDAAVE